jgi:hypothetical protein
VDHVSRSALYLQQIGDWCLRLPLLIGRCSFRGVRIFTRNYPAIGSIVIEGARSPFAKEDLVLIPFIRLAIEANEVIGLRMMKIISGGPDAMTEMQLMLTEKINASAEAGTNLLFGQGPTAIVARYREHVANNQRRLSASP